MFHWPVNLTPRTWQKHFLHAYHQVNKKNFVLDVVPAAGKTAGGLAVAHDLFNAERIRRMIVISHTDQIRSQWVAEAARWGIHLGTTLVPSTSAWGALHGLSRFCCRRMVRWSSQNAEGATRSETRLWRVCKYRGIKSLERGWAKR
jgi:hypothetical protein